MQMTDVTTIDTHIHTQLNWVFDRIGRPQLTAMPEAEQRLDALLPDVKSVKTLLRRLEQAIGYPLPQNCSPATVGDLHEALQQTLEYKRQMASKIITVPNILSLVRLVIIPVYAVMYLQADSAADYYAAGILLALSCLTDLFDGFIARRFRQISTLGKLLDPVADKLTQCTMLLCLASTYPVLWGLWALFFVKELFQFIATCWHLKHGQMLDGALMAGKVCTNVLFISAILMVLFPGMPAGLRNGLIALCALFLIIAFVAYFRAYVGKSKKVHRF